MSTEARQFSRTCGSPVEVDTTRAAVAELQNRLSGYATIDPIFKTVHDPWLDPTGFWCSEPERGTSVSAERGL
jgi:hypothetical protein